MKINIPVSPGELIDKMTILELKASLVKDSTKIPAIVSELNSMSIISAKLVKKYPKKAAELKKLKKSLFNVNKKLWGIEDKIRRHENDSDFDTAFIELARSVYINNDKRSALKSKINSLLDSKFIEVKQYAAYN